MVSEEKSGAGPRSSLVRLADRAALCGFLLYAVFAPHSIAGAEISLGPVGAGLLARKLLTGRTGLRRTPLDLPIWLFLGWTVLSCLLSEEPRVSLLKLQSVCVVLLFYLAQGVLTRRTALAVVLVMIASGVAGSVWSVLEIARGRGVLISEMASDSPLLGKPLAAGDAVWRVGGKRVSSALEIDEAIRQARVGEPLSVSFISRGEHGEWPGFVVTDELKKRASPSGIKGAGPTHRFRASGWTRHYETFCETLQILAQLALGLCLSNLRAGRGRRRLAWLMAASFLLLGVGIVLTAMRTVMVALAFGACVVAWRAAQGRWARAGVLLALIALLISGALVVRETRSAGALMLRDDSSRLRMEVARAGLARIGLHPLFGNGMDAVKRHWSEWGFPGSEVVHLHSTPLQIAFDRGLPALLFWLWIIYRLWRLVTRAEKLATEEEDVNARGVLLGVSGALAGFFASSLVNYNFGDGEVALVFWWLAGTAVVLSRTVEDERTRKKSI